MNVGFIGLGSMGSGMAASLLKAGHKVTVYNRTSAKAEPLVKRGARRAETIGATCDGDATFTMLANDHAVESVTFGKDGIIQSLGADTVHISSSTISVSLAERLTTAHSAARRTFVTAPVFGRPDAAQAGNLFVVAAGTPEAIRKIAPLLDAIGQKTSVISQTPSHASLIKLSGNFLSASIIEALGEAIALVSKAGIDRHKYVEVLTSTLFSAPVFKTYGALIADGKYQPAGFGALLGQKDIHLVLEAADDLRVALPVASLIRDRFLTLLAHGGEKLDWSAIGSLASEDAGAIRH